MKHTLATATLAFVLLAAAPSALAENGWWNGNIKTVYTHESGTVWITLDAEGRMPHERGIQCGDSDSPNIQLRRPTGNDAASRFEVMYDNLARALSEGRWVSLYLREQTFSDGGSYCVVGNVGRWS